MNAPRSAREALILEALGELDQVLEKTEAARIGATEAAQRVEAAAAGLDAAAGRYAAELARLNDETKQAVTSHLERRINSATSEGLAAHRKAMQEAATLAFAERLAPAVREVARQMDELHAHKASGRFAWAKHTAVAVLAALLGSAVGWVARG